MKIIKLPLADLQRPERNVRIHTERQLNEFERSIRMFGQIRPIVVDENNTIMAGVGCYETLTRMGVETADVYRVQGLTENQKKKLMIADNKVFGLGIDDLDTFNKFLDELQDDLDIPGFDEEILKSMTAAADDVTDMVSEYGLIDDQEIENMKAAGERKDALPAPSTSEPNREPFPKQKEFDENAPGMVADMQRSVICPSCGETIWL